jgi:hypothetical protein
VTRFLKELGNLLNTRIGLKSLSKSTDLTSTTGFLTISGSNLMRVSKMKEAWLKLLSSKKCFSVISKMKIMPM